MCYCFTFCSNFCSKLYSTIIYYVKKCFGIIDIDRKNQTNDFIRKNCWSQTDDDYDYINENECLIGETEGLIGEDIP